MRGRPAKAPKVTRVCQQCGNEWQAYEWENNTKLLYCSRECFYKSRVGRPKVLRVEPEERPCLRCGKVFLVGGEGNRQKIAKYCSRTCAKHGYWGEAVHKAARQMTEVQAAWFAGVFDGEGCVGWPRRTVIHSVSLAVSNTNKPLIDKINEVTGTGRVIPGKRRSNRHSPHWKWACYGDNARSILRQILPWLIVKREAAEVALGIVKAAEPPWTQRSRSMQAVDP